MRVQLSLPQPTASALNTLLRHADGLGAKVYAVGGAVRDRLRGTDVQDMDLVVEGDAVRLALMTAADDNVRARTHGRFGTAQLVFPDGVKLDVATARTETYQHPGALPDVAAAPIEADLRRRDFSINAMALRLTECGWGELLDPFGGREDLSHRRIHILHPRSFQEDPTRILRALRFAVRLRFSLGPETRALALAAVRRGALSSVSGERVWREIALGLAEAEPTQVARQWEEFGVLRALHARWDPDPTLIQRSLAALAWFAALRQPDQPDRSLLLLASLMALLDPGEAATVCAVRLRLPPWRCAAVEQCLRDGPDLARVVSGLRPSVLAQRMSTYRLETLLYAAAMGDTDSAAAIARFLVHVRHVRLRVDGSHLIARGAASGPAMGAALRSALAEKQDGRLASVEEELSFLMQRLALNRELVIDDEQPTDR